MTTLYYSHPVSAEHLTPEGHPERPARMEAVAAGLSDLDLDRREAPEGDVDDVLRCHPRRYVDRVRAAVPERGSVALDADTHMSPKSYQAAIRAVGAACAAVDAVIAGEAANAFVGCRPPGHHAERETAMGFCLFGTAAIAAMRAIEVHGLSRVAVADFDVHHGNGTQDLLWDEARTLFASTHQMPLYPGSGARHETGAHANVVNVPLAPMTGGGEARRAWMDEILPAFADFRPELIVISAGFDAHAADPLANLNWREEDFAAITAALCDVADDAAGGRVVSTLEGGYDLAALRSSVRAHVEVLRERGA